MVKTASTMLPLGTPAPEFSLVNVDGRTVSLADYQGAPALVVIFMCNHCPFVKHLASALAAFGHEYQAKGAAIVAISSNDVSEYPQDSPEQMVHEAETHGYSFAYLFDEDQSVAKAYRAACTPDFYVFDSEQKLAYRGQFDESRPGNDLPVNGVDLKAAVDALLQGNRPTETQTPAIGCNIKWKADAAPEYFDPQGTG